MARWILMRGEEREMTVATLKDKRDDGRTIVDIMREGGRRRDTEEGIGGHSRKHAKIQKSWSAR